LYENGKMKNENEKSVAMLLLKKNHSSIAAAAALSKFSYISILGSKIVHRVSNLVFLG
jgi:hypothetical protein